MGRLSLRRSAGPSAALMVALAALLLGDCAEQRREPGRADALVTRVVDGDTVEVVIDDRREDVRYIGIDTPETVSPDDPVQCMGPKASAFNDRFVEGRRVTLVFDAERRDKYGRLLAYVYRGRRLVNAILLRRGLARTLTIAPNDSMAERFAEIEERAGRSARGLWGACAS